MSLPRQRRIDRLDAVSQHRGVDRPDMHEYGFSVRFYSWLRRPSFFATDIDARIAGRAAGLISNWSFGNTNRTHGPAVSQMWLMVGELNMKCGVRIR